MKYSLTDIYVKILFQKSNFPVTARDLIFFFENTLQLEAAPGGVRNFTETMLKHRCFTVKLAKVVSVCLVHFVELVLQELRNGKELYVS